MGASAAKFEVVDQVRPAVGERDAVVNLEAINGTAADADAVAGVDLGA